MLHICIFVYVYIYGASHLTQWVKNLPAMQEMQTDTSSIPGSGRSPREGNGNPFWYSCLENSTDREDWQAIVNGIAKE